MRACKSTCFLKKPKFSILYVTNLTQHLYAVNKPKLYGDQV